MELYIVLIFIDEIRNFLKLNNKRMTRTNDILKNLIVSENGRKALKNSRLKKKTNVIIVFII